MRLQYRTPPFLLAIGHACIDLCQGAIPALLPTLLIQRHLDYTAAAGLIFAANVVSSVIQPLFGHIVDRLRIPWLMPVGLLIAGSGLALSGLFTHYWLIALCMGISGVGIAAFHPEAARQVHELSGKQKATSMSIFSLGGNIGFALGPLVMTTFLLFFGLSGPVALLPLLLGVAVILLYAFKQTSSSEKSERVQEAERIKGRCDDHWWAFTRLTGAIVCRSIIFYGLDTFLALYWIKVLHQTQTAGAAALSVLLFAGLGGTLLGGQLADRYGRRSVVLLAFGTLFPLLLIFVLVSPWNMFLAWVLLIPIGVCLFAPFSVMVVMGQEYLPNHIGIASGITLGVAVTVGGIAAPLLGKVADLYGIAPALLGLAFVPVFAAGWAMTLPDSSVLNMFGARVAERRRHV
jgi:FSR family fosmidomycin resistance protein-like MFS transporter